MKMRWLAAGLAAVLITGGAATVAQRIITQKTRGVLPETNDSAHADSRLVTVRVEPTMLKVEAAPQPHRVLSPVAEKAVGFVADPPAVVEAPEPPAPLPAVATVPAISSEPASSLPSDPTHQPVTPTVAVIEANPQANLSTSEPPPAPSADAAINPATVQAAPHAATAEPAPAKADPVEAVESFVERNRKEAETAIQALSTEADDLKARLTKVEAALVRWQNFSRALNADQPASQTEVPVATKPNWKRPTPEAPPQSTRTEGSSESPKPVPDPTPEPPAAEVPANPPVPSPDEPPAPAPTEPPPGDKPMTEPPLALPVPKG